MKIPGAEEIEVRYGTVMSASEQVQTGIAIGHTYVLIGVGIKAIYMTVDQYKTFYAAMHYTDEFRPLGLRTEGTSAPEQSSPVWSPDEEGAARETLLQATMPPGKTARPPRMFDQMMEQMAPGVTVEVADEYRKKDIVNPPPIGSRKYELYNLQDELREFARKATEAKREDCEEDGPMEPRGRSEMG